MEQFASLAFLVAATLAAAIQAFEEYRNNGSVYLRRLSIGLVLTALWHATNWYLSVGELRAGLYLSSLLVFAAGLNLLFASRLQEEAPARADRQIAIMCGAYTAFLGLDVVIAPYTGWGTLELSWLLIAALYLALPVVSFRAGASTVRSLLQLLAAICMLGGVFLLESATPQHGGILYLFNGLLVPAYTVSFIGQSMKDAHSRLSERESNYANFYDSIRDVFFRLDSNGIILYVSPSISHFDLSEDSVLGHRITDLIATDVEWETTMPQIRRAPCLLNTTLKDSRRRVELHFTQNPDNSEEVLTRLSDIEERERIAEQFYESQRREGIGQLAGGIAHDFNNLLQGIMGHAELIGMQTSPGQEKLRESSEVILQASRRAAELCYQLLQYAGRSPVEMGSVDLKQIVLEAISITTPSLPADLTLKAALPDQSCPITADPVQLSQVVINILKNAVEAVTGEGTVQISLGHTAAGLLLTISDSGAGIPENIQEQIFEPFFSTKSTGHGLGLAAAKGIIEKHNASIEFSSVPGKGSSFFIHFPVDKKASGPNYAPAPRHRSHQDFSLLVVDDDPVILALMETLLINDGHKVKTATNGEEGLKAFQADSFDLVITDLKMPVMDGVTFMSHVRKSHPAMPLIVVSGYNELSGDKLRAITTDFSFLPKPFKKEDFLAMVQDTHAAMMARLPGRP